MDRGKIDPWCDCISEEDRDPNFDHKESEHKFDCGGWTWDPPCGGCIQCIKMQIAYYKELDREDDRG